MLSSQTFACFIELMLPSVFVQDRQSKLEQILGYRLLSLLCVPIMRKTDEEVMALACLINKQGSG